MSDIFSGLNSGAIKFTDSAINKGGPLPSSVSGGPAGSNGVPDGRINFNNNLLDGITPYAYGEPGTMGSDRNYQQIPNRMQQIIPLLHLPHADDSTGEQIFVSHAVDQGDICFLIGTNRVQGILFNKSQLMDDSIVNAEMPARNAFCNISTVNYILAGLQRIRKRSQNNHSLWKKLAKDLNFDHNKQDSCMQTCAEINLLLRTGFIPFGIAAGSEKQGGLHETGLAPVQAAANYVTTLTIDGQNRDLVNFWRHCDLSAGDQLILRLEYLPTKSFTLNHYYKGVVHQTFGEEKECWQLVPDVYRATYDCTKDVFGGTRCAAASSFDYRLHGYWRIGQIFHHRISSDKYVQNFANDMTFLRGHLLHITFAPVWVQFCRCTDVPTKAKRHAEKKSMVMQHITNLRTQKRKMFVLPRDNSQSSKKPTLLLNQAAPSHAPSLQLDAKAPTRNDASLADVLQQIAQIPQKQAEVAKPVTPASTSAHTDSSSVSVSKVKVKDPKKVRKQQVPT